ncbi:MAG: hypothetical protein IPI11_06815 [Haliscomenobacter sp.]|nr:hypothetical protein [Haliscomenobacter sp.]
MKTKLVLWGTNAQDERVLVGLELLPKENLVKAYVFPEEVATEEFSQKMLDEWRDSKPVDFPEGYTMEEKELSLSETILPAGIKPERDDIIHRAQTEWHFVVLSSKLHEAYLSELSEIKERISKLPRFDGGVWEELKGFWAKVQDQVRDKNLFREHGDALRDFTNELFTDLKSLRNKLDEEFELLSKENFERFQNAFSEIERKLASGGRLQPLFDELKELQRKFRDAKFTKEHRNKVWDTLDALFKSVKEKKFGGSSPSDDRSPSDRLSRRFEGLLSAIEKMERSIKRDADDLDFQKHKVEVTDGQLEAQIRQAKIMMIEERIRSKQDKLNEMLTTKIDLEKRMASQKERDARREEREKLEETKKAIQDKIASDIKAAAEARGPESEKLEKLAEEISHPASKPKQDKPASEDQADDTLLEAVGATLTESLEDLADTAKAVAEVVGEKLNDALSGLKEDIENAVEAAKDLVSAPQPDTAPYHQEEEKSAQEPASPASSSEDLLEPEAEEVVETEPAPLLIEEPEAGEEEATAPQPENPEPSSEEEEGEEEETK